MNTSQPSLSFGFLMVALAFLFTPVASAQNVPFPIPGGGGACPNSFGMSIADVTVQPGEIFEMVVSVDNPNPIEGFVLTLISPSPADCQILTTELGAGVEAYAAANGTLPPGDCDVVVWPDGSVTTGAMIFSNGPYQSSIYGTEMYTITCVAGMTPGEVLLPWTVDEHYVGYSCGAVIVTIADPTPAVTEVMRGDVNLDTSCNLTDAINLLDYLYVGNFDTTCPDACDVDDSGSVNLADAVNLLSGLFGGGFMMEDTCKADTTADTLAECIGSPCP